MHAPGPWHVDGKTVKSADHQRYYTVARVDNTKFTPEANAGNAKLIAAAPDLLAFAKLVVRGLESGSIVAKPIIDFDPDAEQAGIRSLHAFARSVIASATKD